MLACSNGLVHQLGDADDDDAPTASRARVDVINLEGQHAAGRGHGQTRVGRGAHHDRIVLNDEIDGYDGGHGTFGENGSPDLRARQQRDAITM